MKQPVKIPSLFLASAVLAIIFPLVNLYYIFPSVTVVLVQNAEKDAVQMARHLKSLVTDDMGQFRPKEEINKVVSSAWRYLNIENVKIISESGEVIYSPDKTQVGTIVGKDYFNDIIAKGHIYSKTSTSNSVSLDGKHLKADVVEVYVPVMSRGSFIGAFELYYDITELDRDVRAATMHSSLLSLLLMAGFFGTVMLIILRSSSRTFEAEISDASLNTRSPYYYLGIIAATLFASEIIIMLIVRALPIMSRMSEAIWDATLLLMLASPALYLFVYNPLLTSLKRQRKLVTEKELLMREAYHRVKNNLNTVQNLLILQSETTQNPETKDMFDVGRDRIHAMSLIHERLYKSSNLKDIDCAEYIKTLVTSLFDNYSIDSTKIQLKLDVEKMHVKIDDLIPLGLLINEIVTNTLKHAFPGDRTGTVSISIGPCMKGKHDITIKDDGVGFNYTEPTSETKTLGLQLIGGLAKQLGSNLTVQTGKGTSITISVACSHNA